MCKLQHLCAGRFSATNFPASMARPPEAGSDKLWLSLLGECPEKVTTYGRVLVIALHVVCVEIGLRQVLRRHNHLPLSGITML